jgi:hypothetical protein
MITGVFAAIVQRGNWTSLAGSVATRQEIQRRTVYG